MKKIRGNATAIIQVKNSGGKNIIGERTNSWFDAVRMKGYLDLAAGDSKYSPYDAKIRESTHVFICDYNSIKALTDKWKWDELNFRIGVVGSIESEDSSIDVTSENARIAVKGEIYDILYIDNPMEMNYQLEFYLRRVGV